MSVDIKKAISLDKLSDLSYVDKIYLYGSRARDTHRERSDIDIAIQCPRATNSEWHNILNIIDDAPTLLKVDCVRLDKLSSKSPLLVSILEEGIVLYECTKEKC